MLMVARDTGDGCGDRERDLAITVVVAELVGSA
jgi:hypothetical protein